MQQTTQKRVDTAFKAIGDLCKIARDQADFEVYRGLVDLVVALEQLFPKEMEQCRKSH